MTDSYYTSRYTWNNDRTIVWKEIVRFLQPSVPLYATVLDIGAGYCDFINNVKAQEKIALDYSPDFKEYANKDVRTIVSPVTNMSMVENEKVDLVFASNLFEHLSDEELLHTITEVKRVLKNRGKLILMQPNFRLAYKTYFDDPTHKKVFSDVSLKAFLVSHGFEIEMAQPRFLPFSLASRPSLIPLFPWVVRLYLNLPWRPFAGQMLFIAVKR